jgi:hypothetical protein
MKLGIMTDTEGTKLVCPYTLASGTAKNCITKNCMSWHKVTDCEKFEKGVLVTPESVPDDTCKYCGRVEEFHNKGFCRRLLDY